MNSRLRMRFSPVLIRIGLPIVILTAVMLIAACSSAESDATPTFTPVPQLSTEASLGESISLSPGQSAEIADEDVELAFHRVANDSRCPAGAQCVNAGTAVVVMQLISPEFDPGQIEFIVSPGGGGEILAGPYTVTLLTLDPDPPSGDGVDAGDYRITFNVSRN
ncbi:MAG: hypothetical protein VB860_06405 [Dehalococcoidia bacterium]